MTIQDTLRAVTAENKSFSKITPGLQTIWDSTSLGLLKTCAYKYYMQQICGWVPKRTARPLLFGILLHECLERYDHYICQGKTHKAAMRLTVRYALKKAGTYTEGVFTEWDKNEDDLRTRENLVRAVVWYLDEYGENDPVKTLVLDNGKPAVELSFKLQTSYSSSKGESYFLSGHMDRLVTILSEIWVMDHKTTKSTIGQYFFKNFSPSNQMSFYTLASKLVYSQPALGVIVNGIQIGKTFSNTMRGFVTRTPAQLDEWYEDLEMWLGLAELYAETHHWPMNDESCQKYGGCPFRGICSKDPSVRETYLNADFKKQIWDPTINRGL